MSRARALLKWGAILLLATVATGALLIRAAIRDLDSVQVTEDVHMITGLGSNVAVLKTAAGAVIVDTMTFHVQGRLIAKKAEELTGVPVAVIVNTHYHLDHSHGNPGFETGVRVVATERTLHHMTARDAGFWKGHEALLPAETFSEADEIRLGGKTIRLLHPGRGHTDGDLVALFVEDGVLATGDLFFREHYPNIDLEAGGSVQSWSATLDRVLDLPFVHVIPGHGALGGRAELLDFQRFIAQLAKVGDDAATAGWDLKTTIAKGELTEDEGYTNILPILSRDFVITRAWEEATGAVLPDER